MTKNEKISAALKGRNLGGRPFSDCICKCGKSFLSRNVNPKFCSKKCSLTYRDFSVRSVAATKIQKKLLEEGRHNGFPSRKDKQPSWAEQYFIDRFVELDISFERDLKINRFFADFAFTEKKIVLEIDGKQHQERKEYDKNRDSIIESEGWKVFRIDWKGVGDKTMYEKFVKFLLVLK